MITEDDQRTRAETVLVTGGTGFVGRAVLHRLLRERSYRLRAAVRSGAGRLPPGVEVVRTGDLTSPIRWREALEGVSVVIHAAARVHVVRERVSDPLAEFRRVNVDGSLQLAQKAIDAGVSRFVFVSSIKVNGEGSARGQPFRASDAPAPSDPYAISKWEAEQGLIALAQGTGMELTIVRPPLVYGPGVKANFLRLLRLVERGWPLPLGAVQNRRSLVALDNLVDLLLRCCVHPAAAGQTLLVSDGHDLSTSEWIHAMARAMGRSPRLLPIAPAWLRLGGRLSGTSPAIDRLLGSLEVDIRDTCKTLDWTPPVSVEAGLARTVAVRDSVAPPGTGTRTGTGTGTGTST